MTINAQKIPIIQWNRIDFGKWEFVEKLLILLTHTGNFAYKWAIAYTERSYLFGFLFVNKTVVLSL